VPRADAPAGDPPDGPVPERHAIRGFFGATLSLTSSAVLADLLEAMGYEKTGSEGHRRRYEAGGELGSVLDLVTDPQAPRGHLDAGTVRHVAFQVTLEEQSAWREVLSGHGLRPTEIIDRKRFRSVYARTEAGILFEFATKEPGYTVDEDIDELGERLVLPDWLEDQRAEIEADLPDLPAATDVSRADE
jgi:glyoxalase family protein